MDSTLIVQRHPILIDHDTQVVMDLRPGESLYAFLYRHIENLDGQQMVVQIGDTIIPREQWMHVRPKHGHNIIVRNTLHRSALFIVAMIALSVFTLGAGTAVAAGAGFLGVGVGVAGSVSAMALVGAVQVVGALVVNKVLGPKPQKPSAIDRDQVYSLSNARNTARPWEPAGLLFGSVRVTPDVISLPYSVYRGNDQYLSMVLSPGVNVDRYDTLYLGETPLSNYEGVSVWQSGFSGMADQDIPVYTNADTIAGGTLDADVPVVRTSSPDTVVLQVDINYLLFDVTSKGKPKDNQETLTIQYRPVGSGSWLSFGTFNVKSREQTEQRRSYTKDVAPGQYEVSVKREGNDTDGSGATCNFAWATLVSYQRDTATYAGLARIALEMKATGQLNGAPDEVRAIMHAKPIPLWNGTSWVTATTRETGLSNAAANALQYLRGYRDEFGNLIAGVGLTDDMIDIESFKGWMLECTERGYNFDAWITGDRNHEDMLQAIGLAGMGKVTFAPGRATAAWAAEGQGVDAIVNMGTIKKSSFQVNYTLMQSADGIEYSYFNRDTWKTETLRVAAPGVTTMLNPATVTGEGVTTEAQAAILARYHMGQMIYQSKDVSYSTDLEHLAYSDMSMIELQHDLTQWGYGGRIRSATNVGGVVTLILDDTVPPPPSGNAYVGLRIPGEAGYRVFRVASFGAPSDTISLVGAWPGDAAFPGNSDSNPAHDTIWIYDFKSTPGNRCRVVSIAPEDDLKGAQVAVVEEGDEFWNYVYTGEYVPPNSGSLLNTRPIASNLQVTEEHITQGDTVFSQLFATWDVAGVAINCVVSCGRTVQEMREVANVAGRSAQWRVDGDGPFVVTVLPIGEGGVPGVPVTLVVGAVGPAVPPRLVDTFDVIELDGGIRRYEWGFNPTTIRSADFAGVEIRYVSGSVPTPDWDAMIPLAEGYFPSTVESPNPVAGEWTFACRSVSTWGVLSDSMFVLSKTLTSNLGQITEQTLQDLVDQQNALAQEALDRFNADAAVAAAAAADAQAKADAALDAALAASASAVPWDSGADYLEGQMVLSGGNLYLALQDVPAGTPLSDVAYWKFVGAYENIGSALAASISIGEANATELAAQATQLDAVEASLADKADASALNALDVRVTENEGDISTLATNLSSVEASLAGKADASAVTLLEGRVDTVEDGVSANSLAVTKVNARLSGDAGNLVTTFDFTAGIGAWAAPAYTEASIPSDPVQVPRLVLPPGTESYQNGVPPIVASPGDVFDLSINMLNTGSAVGQFGLAYFNAAGSPLQWAWLPAAAAGTWAVGHKGTLPPAPAGTVSVMPLLVAGSGNYLVVTRPSVTRRDATGANNVSAISALQANATGSGNLLVNSAFDKQLQEWEWDSNPGGGAHVYVTNDSDTGVPKGKNAAIILYGSTGGPSLFRQKRRSVTPGKTYIASGYFSGNRGGIRVWGINYNGSYYGEIGVSAGANGGGGDLSGWTRRSVKFTVPGGVTWVWVQFGSLAGTPGGYLRATNMMLEEARDANQVNPSPWSLGGYEYYASYTLSLDVNGYVSGFQSSNNGQSADFTILADNFRIMKPGGGARTEFSGGNWRVYDASGVLRVRMGVW